MSLDATDTPSAPSPYRASLVKRRRPRHREPARPAAAPDARQGRDEGRDPAPARDLQAEQRRVHRQRIGAEREAIRRVDAITRSWNEELASTVPSLGAVVSRAVAQIVGDAPREEVVVTALRRELARVRGEHTPILRVSTRDDAPWIERLREEGRNGRTTFSVRGDEGLEPGKCVLELGARRVDLSPETQLAAFDDRLRSAAGAVPPRAAPSMPRVAPLPEIEDAPPEVETGPADPGESAPVAAKPRHRVPAGSARGDGEGARADGDESVRPQDAATRSRRSATSRTATSHTASSHTASSHTASSRTAASRAAASRADGADDAGGRLSKRFRTERDEPAAARAAGRSARAAEGAKTDGIARPHETERPVGPGRPAEPKPGAEPKRTAGSRRRAAAKRAVTEASKRATVGAEAGAAESAEGARLEPATARVARSAPPTDAPSDALSGALSDATPANGATPAGGAEGTRTARSVRTRPADAPRQGTGETTRPADAATRHDDAAAEDVRFPAPAKRTATADALTDFDALDLGEGAARFEGSVPSQRPDDRAGGAGLAVAARGSGAVAALRARVAHTASALRDDAGMAVKADAPEADVAATVRRLGPERAAADGLPPFVFSDEAYRGVRAPVGDRAATDGAEPDTSIDREPSPSETTADDATKPGDRIRRAIARQGSDHGRERDAPRDTTGPGGLSASGGGAAVTTADIVMGRAPAPGRGSAPRDAQAADRHAGARPADAPEAQSAEPGARRARRAPLRLPPRIAKLIAESRGE